MATVRACLIAAVLCLTFIHLAVAGTKIHRAKAVPSASKSNSSQVGRGSMTESFGDATESHQTKRLYSGHSGEVWIYSILGAMLVGLSGIFPLLVIPLEAGPALKHGAGAARLKLFLSFAVGGLLGDVFLHLLPEAWAHIHASDHTGHNNIGLLVIVGILFFLIVEKAFPEQEDEEDESKEDEKVDPNTSETNSSDTVIQNGTTKDESSTLRQRNGNNNIKLLHENLHLAQNGSISKPGKTEDTVRRKNSVSHIKVTGWLNLMANVIDNFTHGLAVAGSFIAGNRVGFVTTFAILVHEVPHEVGDFAILLRSGFDRWKAAKAQLMTASGGMVGALTALLAESAQVAGDSTAWILPFTSGGFLYIALVTVVPDLLKEKNPWESLKQVSMLCGGISSMVIVTFMFG